MVRIRAAFVVASLALAACSTDDGCVQGDPCQISCEPGETGFCIAGGHCVCRAGAAVDAMTGVDPCTSPVPGSLVINELMIDGPAPEDTSEFIELVNATDAPVRLSGLELTSNSGDSQKSRVQFQSGCLPARGAVAIYRDVATWQWNPHPMGLPQTVATTGAFGFPNSVDFQFVLAVSGGGAIIDQAMGSAGVVSDGVSANRSPDGTAGAFMSHDAVSTTGLSSSPARCANGGSFAAGCLPVGGGDGGVVPGGDGGIPQPCPAAVFGDLVINEVMIDGDGADDPTEFVELVNTRDTEVGLAGVVVRALAGEALSNRIVFQSGCMPPRGAVAMFAEVANWMWIPDAPVGFAAETSRFAFHNSNDFIFELVGPGEVILSRAEGSSALITSGVSVNRVSDGMDGSMARHDEVSSTGLALSPGQCANGGYFNSGCVPGESPADSGAPVADAGPDDPDAAPGPPDAAVSPCRAPSEGEIVLNELMIDAATPENENEFVELVNATAEPLRLDGLVLVSNSGENLIDRIRFTAGCLPAHGVVAAFPDEASWIWNPMPDVMPAIEHLRFSFNNNDPFRFELRNAAGAVISSAAGPSQIVDDGVSVNRTPNIGGAEFAPHSEVAADGRTSSPGLCATGGRFDVDCPIGP